MNIYNYYIQHSQLSDPNKYSTLYDELPLDIPPLCTAIQNLILHYADQDMFQYQIPLTRFKEMDIRSVKEKLDLIFSYDERPLNNEREPQNRIIGVCRDNSLLLCSILRHKQIPARLRAGFGNYIIPGIYLDGVYVEYWNSEKKRWCSVDTRTSDNLLKKANIDLDFDLHDLPQTKYISAAAAWQSCRSGHMNPNRFGSRMHRGLWYVRNRLLQDFALLNKHEGLIWDLWGLMLSRDEENISKVPMHQFAILDQLSELIINHSYNINAIHDFYQSNSILHMPKTILVDNPFSESSPFTVSVIC